MDIKINATRSVPNIIWNNHPTSSFFFTSTFAFIMTGIMRKSLGGDKWADSEKIESSNHSNLKKINFNTKISFQMKKNNGQKPSSILNFRFFSVAFFYTFFREFSSYCQLRNVELEMFFIFLIKQFNIVSKKNFKRPEKVQKYVQKGIKFVRCIKHIRRILQHNLAPDCAIEHFCLSHTQNSDLWIRLVSLLRKNPKKKPISTLIYNRGRIFLCCFLIELWFFVDVKDKIFFLLDRKRKNIPFKYFCYV